jgi:protoheme IX farnesyltransferase
MSTLSSSRSASAATGATVASTGAAHRPGLVRIYAELTKARLSAMVVMSTVVGFVVAGPAAGLTLEWPRLIYTTVGTTLAAASASIFNQLLEVHRDARMERTRHRPLPTGAISRHHGMIAAFVFAHAGVAMLGLLVNLLAAGLAALTIVIYIVLYTPLKTRSTLNTLVGAVCGALPPMIGWVGATGRLDAGAWVLGAILFVWQLPHFLSLAWLYRADYERGGFAMLPVIDAAGALTSRIVLLTSLILIPLGLLVTLSGLAGWLFAIGSALLGLWLVGLAVKLFMVRSDANARRVFLASLAYLSMLMGLLVLDRGPVGRPDIPTMIAETDAELSTASLLPRLGGP